MAHGHHDHTQGHQGHGHGHGHKHGTKDMDWATMIPHLERGAEVYRPLYTEALQWLHTERPGGTGVIVDAGSGPGAISLQLADAFPDARIVAADPEEALLARATQQFAAAGIADRTSTLRVELPDSIDELPHADLIWAARSLHHVGDQRAAIAALASRLNPGGTLALVEGGLPLRSLPRDFGFGRPGLETRADAIEDTWFDEMRRSLPGAKQDTEDWTALLTDAGLTGARSRTFLLDLPAPLPAAGREMLVDMWERRRSVFEESLDAEDVATLDRLLDPQDPQGLHRREDVFLLVAHTVHVAVKA
ncbi:trans-aconitate 2-methyltransferase [Streptomyces sp. VRA16 Mangrove soil]|uniref:class I SAM-dependent methyltransferase n=1 Tax=Streptomyces sp. VRA16 Mangrove soil TaxID=2817434 RepID=UPI001A9F6C2E|nr:class I SAM-dependent methyltransferase [Streptomyces sp. VRA16 Mangrove soil]MBO1331045.1 class I SAM-dependent methyltransferase [Streptomyces sp. VRA16 Mangrove soil]